jgi:putative endonuclease
MFFAYVLLSLKDHRLYVGMTSNLDARLKKHNDGGVRSTKHRRPLKLVWQEGCATRNEARTREKFLKSGPGHAFLKAVVAI